MPFHFLVVGSETADERDARRVSAGATSAESYVETLRSIEPTCLAERVSCLDRDEPFRSSDLAEFDAVFFAGSPIQMDADTPDTRAAAGFMRSVFASGVPSFGSCAGLQIATVAAGGTVRPRNPRMEAGFARRIFATSAGATHPLLAGRPKVWDAPAMHSSEVATLPPGATLLASTETTLVQAVEIRQGPGVFWGVQYHPELTLAEIAASLRREVDDLIADGMAANRNVVRHYADSVEALGSEPARRDLAWQLGLTSEVTEPAQRTVELRNFIDHVGRRSQPKAA